jgi:UDP-glucuronate 4-epimerase
MHALVTGCAGFIGSQLSEALLQDGNSVVGVDCFNDNYGRRGKLRNLEIAHQWDTFNFLPLDLARGDLDDLVDEVDVVFHLAAEPGVRASWGSRFESYIRNNILATQHLLEAMRRSPHKRFVYASSSSIYGQAQVFPTPETALPHPVSPYGTTKLAAEHLCNVYHANFGVETVALRLFTVYGPRQRPDMAFTRFCRAALSGEPITVYGDGSQTRDFTFVGDVVTAMRSAAVAPAAAGGTYNLGGGSRVLLLTVFDLLREMSNKPLELVFQAEEHGDVRDTVADTSRARQDLGFRPATSFEEGLKLQFAWATETPSKE